MGFTARTFCCQGNLLYNVRGGLDRVNVPCAQKVDVLSYTASTFRVSCKKMKEIERGVAWKFYPDSTTMILK
eukprot:4190726-Amphidinium_carterae.1